MRGRPFQPGNTFGRGRPRGSRNKTSILEEILLDSGPEIIQTLADLAKKGDPTALKLSVPRLIAPLKPVAKLAVEQAREEPLGVRLILVPSPKHELEESESAKPDTPKLAAAVHDTTPKLAAVPHQQSGSPKPAQSAQRRTRVPVSNSPWS